MKIVGIIPARYAASRFPGKPLVDIQGKYMIQRVYEQAIKANLHQVIIATDDKRIYDAALQFNAEVMMTATHHLNGTSRCAEVTQHIDADACINIQGDEPFIQPEQIQQVAELLKQQAAIATLKKKISEEKEIMNTNVVKVVCNTKGEALYFSRSMIPFNRNANQAIEYYKHIGIYGFQKEILLQIQQLAVSALEQAESLEQLRWLENGYKIIVAETPYETIAIDTPEDLQKITL